MLKAHDVAAVIEERVDCFEFDPMSLQKLLYYVQAWHLAIKGDPLFEGHFEAGPGGPVLPEVLNVHPRKSDPVSLNHQVSDLIWLVVRTYGYLSPGELTVLAKTEGALAGCTGGSPRGRPEREHHQRRCYGRVRQVLRSASGFLGERSCRAGSVC